MKFVRLIVIALALSFGLSVPGCVVRTSPDRGSKVHHERHKSKRHNAHRGHKKHKKNKKYKKHKKHKKSRARKRKQRCPDGYYWDKGKCHHKSKLYD